MFMAKKKKFNWLFKYLVLAFLIIFQSAFLLALCSNNILIASEVYSNYRVAIDSATTSGGSITTAPDNTTSAGSGGSSAIISDSSSRGANSMTSLPIEITWIEAFAPPLSGDHNVSVHLNQAVDRVDFTVSGPQSQTISGIQDSLTDWHFFWAASKMTDGYYTVTAYVFKGDLKVAKSFSIALKNTASELTSTQIISPTETIIKQPIINTTTQQPIAETIIKQPLDGSAVLAEECKAKNITTAKACQNYLMLSAECRDQGFTTSEQCNNYLAIPQECRQKGITNLEECWQVMSLVTAKQPITDILPDCQQQGINNYEDCKLYLSIPPDCRQRGINSVAECDKYISIPPDCRDKNLSAEECQKYMSIPPQCRQQGILDQEACNKFTYQNTMPLQCREGGATTQVQCTQFIFNINLPQECRDQGITGRQECNSYLMIPQECRSQGINNRTECDKYLQTSFMPVECRDQGITGQEECNYFRRNKFKAEDFKGFQPFEIGSDESFRCKEVNITDKAECDKYLTKTRLPKDCQTAGATTEEECKIVFFKKDGPQECLEAKIYNPADCEKYIFGKNAPADCLAAGIKTVEACKKFMFEKYGGKEKIPVDKYPIECQKAGVKTLKECDKIMKTIYLPEECKKNKIIDQAACEAYLFTLRLPTECREQNTKTRQECDKVMFKKYGPPECLAIGITDDKECQDFMFNKYSPQVQCLGQDDWQCKNAIKDRYLGNIVAKQTQYQGFRDKISQLTAESTNLEKIKEKVKSSGELVPLKNNAVGLKVLAAREAIVIDEADNLIQSAPVALMIDSDQDGLPDDLEKRLGTNPTSKDTDSDGYLDGAEFTNGYNPVGLGKLTEELAPIDQAIAGNKVLGQPKTEGALTPEMTIGQVANATNQEGEINYYQFSGQAEAGSVVALYIYSDVPVVVTVKTGEYGNWQYNFNQHLADGEHEVYLAVNDNTGKVVAKSSPLSFFIKEAKAVSISDFVAPALPSQTSEAKSLLVYYIIAGLVITIGLFLFLLFIKQKKIIKL